MLNEEFIQDFVDEAASGTESIETNLVSISEKPGDPEEINSVFRAVHSIKGTAGFFGLKKIVELAHAMENVLGEARSGKLELTGEIIDLLLTANDCLKSMVENVAESDSTEISQFTSKLTLIAQHKPVDMSLIQSSESNDQENNQLASPVQVQPEEQARWKRRESILEGIKHGHKLFKVSLRMYEDLDKNGINPVQFFKKIESIGNIVDSYTDISEIKALDECSGEECFAGQMLTNFLFTTVLEKSLLPMALEIPEEQIKEIDTNIEDEELSAILEEKVRIVPSKPVEEHLDVTDKPEPQEDNAKKGNQIKVEDSIRVHISLLNDLMNLTSEMVLGRNQLLRSMETHRKNIPGMEPILQNIDRITTELQGKIMQTRMQPIANVFNKFPRIIRDLSKKLEKEIQLQLEGTDVELDKSIIEALGDPMTHLVRNAIDHGIEMPRVRESAGKPKIGSVSLKAYHEAGYVNIDIIDDGAGIDSEKIKKKALEKGIVSTSEIYAMGENEILQLLFRPGFSTAEKVTDISGRGVGMDVVKTNIEKLGGTVEIHTVLGKGTTFRLILPLTLAIIPSLIVEVNKNKFALPQVNLLEMVRIKDGDATKKIEYINNAEVLRLRGKLLPIVHLSQVLGIESTVVSSSTVTRVLVLKTGSKKFGLVVDAIHDEEEILVKPLPKHLKNCDCYSGVTILGDGKIAMILEAEGIAAKANLKFTEESIENLDKEVMAKETAMREQQKLLIFQCSGPEMFAIDLSLVSRVDKVKVENIEKIGNKEYIKFRGDSLRIVRPEDYLPVNRQDIENQEMFVIIPKLVTHPIGLLVNKIQDTLETTIILNDQDIKAKGLFGSAILNDRIVLFINIYELFEQAAPEHYGNYRDDSGHTLKEEENGEHEKTVVLLVEDTPFFNRMEKDYLEWAGYEVYAANNGAEALGLLKQKHIDIVVSDIQMPIMDGYELIRKIREDKQLAHLPVIAVTSMTGDANRKNGLKAGFDFYEYKLDKVKLLEKVKMALEQRRNVG